MYKIKCNGYILIANNVTIGYRVGANGGHELKVKGDNDPNYIYSQEYPIAVIENVIKTLWVIICKQPVHEIDLDELINSELEH